MESAEKKEEQVQEEKVEDGTSGHIFGSKKAQSADPKKSKTEMVVLRNTIQALCQSSNPLGKCLEFVQEDMESMTKELEGWKATRRRHSSQLADEEQATEASLRSLNAEL